MVTMWRHDLNRAGDQKIEQAKPPTRIDKRGFNDRKNNMIWARAHCNSEFRVVIAVEKTKTTGRHWYPCDMLVMHIKQLDDDTGVCRVEGVCAKRPCACASA